MKKLFKFTLITSMALVMVSPMITFAQGEVVQVCTGNGIGNILCNIHKLLNSILPVLVALGVVYFVWGVVQYVIKDDEEAKKKEKDRIIYGIIGLTVIVSLWGLVNIVVNTFGLGGQSLSVPTLVPLANQASSAGCSSSLAGNSKLQDVLHYFTCIINDSVIPFIFAIAVVMFVWGAVKFFIINADEEKKRQEGKQFMIWGIIALAVMLSVWGLVGILGTTFGLNTSVLPQVRPP